MAAFRRRGRDSAACGGHAAQASLLLREKRMSEVRRKRAQQLENEEDVLQCSPQKSPLAQQISTHQAGTLLAQHCAQTHVTAP
eukprot:CAMPEP_0183590812 /NCGR_PEP_ID=MMETSP0371-20130417/165132_1 /TAXON_ID=268820 /ORGANISM="Peridinium aciculiferum, Strain PAER-2" /LENGTH=82 /DNA_ID=CAMNT_0025802239 /DNA_START=78 /DNA_END=323 /DNA_ORIENTATION=+